MEKIKVIIDFSGKNFSAGTSEIGGIVLVTHRSLEELKKIFEESLRFHIDGCLKDGDNLAEWVVSGEYVLEYEYTVSALLRRLDGVLTRSALSRVTGINERQLGHYATGKSIPRKAQREKIINGIHRIGKEFIAVE